MIDETTDAARRSWVESANGHPDFPIQNLPFGVFSVGSAETRIGVAIGDGILDLRAAAEAGLFVALGSPVEAMLRAPDLSMLMAGGPAVRGAVRKRASDLLAEHRPLGEAARDAAEHCLVDAARCQMHLPCPVAGFSDFFCGLHHAENAARSIRPDGTLWPNYKWMPIAYNGRAASVRPSGTDFVRPRGQRRAADGEGVEYAPTAMLDYEFELGIWVGQASTMGKPVPVRQAWDHIFGISMLNDWSLRDTQVWEGQPLGPFLSKNALTSVSPWLVTPEALAPFRTEMTLRSDGDPTPLGYLFDAADQATGAIDIELETCLQTSAMRAAEAEGERIAVANGRALYWSFAQMIAHLTSNGSDLRTGELLGTGTISAPDRGGFGSLIELTDGGQRPITLSTGEERRFLEDGDRIIMRGRCARAGFASIGFGDNWGTIVPAQASAD